MNTRDNFELRLTDLLDDLAAARLPDYLGEIQAAARRRPQRPAWSFLARLLPFDELPVWPGSIDRRAWVVLLGAALAALAFAAAFTGSQPKVPAPFGLAANGPIVYDDGSRIVLVDPDGSAPRALTSGAGTATRPSFSLNGQRLAFLLERAGRQAIVVANADGSNQIEVAATDAAEGAQFAAEAPAWSPDSTQIAITVLFLADPGHERGEIWIINADGSGHAVLLPASLFVIQYPSWAPAGDRLAFLGEPTRRAEGFLYVSALDGGGLLRISERASNAQDGYLELARWSPDGQRIAVHYGDSVRLDRDVLVLATDGLAEQVVAGTAADEAQPAWSPDGKSLAFWRSTGVGVRTWQVVIADVEARTERVLKPESETSDTLGWSPDGSWVSVITCPTSTRCQLRLLDATGTGRDPVVVAEVPPKSYDVSTDQAYWSWQRLAP